jgi:hypothetical protein
LDSIVSATPDAPCRSSRECANAPGTFHFTHDFSADLASGRINCGETLDVAATDLAPLASGNVAPAINAQVTVCVGTDSPATSVKSAPADSVNFSSPGSSVLAPLTVRPRAELQ